MKYGFGDCSIGTKTVGGAEGGKAKDVNVFVGSE